MAKGKLRSEMKRRMVQVISALLTNPHIPGFIKGGIYQGNGIGESLTTLSSQTAEKSATQSLLTLK